MRLFLASYRFGAHGDRLLELVGTPGRIGVIAAAADAWPVAARTAALTSDVALLTEAGFVVDGVVAVDADLVGVGRVVAGRTGQVALREDAVRTLAAHGTAAEELVVGAGVRREVGPALVQRGARIRVDGSCRQLEIAPDPSDVHVHLGVSPCPRSRAPELFGVPARSVSRPR